MSTPVNLKEEEVGEVVPEHVSAEQKKKSRRGKGSKQKSFDNFRARKNNEAKDEMTRWLEQKYSIDLGSSLNQTLIDTSPLTTPPRSIKVSLDAFESVVEETVTYLKDALKVEVTEQESEALLRVSKLQVNAKIVLARKKESMAKSDEYNAYGVERTKNNLPRAPFAIAVYISNLGIAEVDRQKFVPEARFPMERFDGADEVHAETSLCDSGRIGYIRCPTAADRALIDGVPGYAQLPHLLNQNPARQLVFDYQPLGWSALIDRYNQLVNKIERKNSYLMKELDFRDARGTSAQLVGSRRTREGTYDAYSCLRIPEPALAMGACFRYSHADEPYHDRRTAHISRIINTDGFLAKIQSCCKRSPAGTSG